MGCRENTEVYSTAMGQTIKLAGMDGLMVKPADCLGPAWGEGRVWHTCWMSYVELK